jgi:hypothetical protein
MSEQNPQEENLSEAFRNLGKNIVNVFRAAWDSPDRKNLQQEVENGLHEFGATIKKEIDEFSESPTGHQIKSDVETLKDRVRSGETEAKVRSEVMNALRIVNTELGRISQDISGTKTPTGSAPASPEENKPGTTSSG